MGYFMSLVIILSILSFAFPSNAYSLTELNSDDGFTTDLIHRDSLISPIYDSTASHLDRISKAIQRSKSRADRFSFGSFASGVPSCVVMASEGDYIMKINLGAPPVEINLNLDTGSIFSWTQCAPCDNCFPQNQPLFTPKASSTYKPVPGNSAQCKALGGRSSLVGDNTCRYSVTYCDTSYSHGTISLDTLRLNSTSGSPIVHKNFIFGCGYENIGTFRRGMSGIIGMGRGPGSLVSQMQSVIGGKFSYCLLSRENSNSRSSKMHFGSKAVVSGSGVVSTGLHFFKNIYAAKFKGISVRKNKLAAMISLSNSSSSSKILGFFNERIVIDSGSTLSFLPKKFYNPLEAAMRKDIKLERANPVNELLRVCYKTPPDGKMKAPIVTVHFVGGDVKLPPLNTFIKASEGVHCLGFAPREDVAIFGNLGQMNFLVGYDIKKMTISFKQTDCSKQ